jgi:hypothetical protein
VVVDEPLGADLKVGGNLVDRLQADLESRAAARCLQLAVVRQNGGGVAAEPVVEVAVPLLELGSELGGGGVDLRCEAVTALREAEQVTGQISQS